MPDYTFELDNLTFSYSSVSLFDICRYAFKLTYIDVEDRASNFFAEYGSLMHHVLESYWRGNITKDEMTMTFQEAYSEFIVSPPPPFPAGMEERYYSDALAFFNDFQYERDDYDVIQIEAKYTFMLGGKNFVIRPDLILQEKSTGKVILVDFKTSKPVKGKKQDWDTAKLNDYIKQTVLYAHFFEKHVGIHIDEIRLLFARLNKEYIFQPTEEQIADTLQWLENTIQLIQWEEDFEPHIDNYFCANLCSVRNYCKFWKEVVFKEEFDPRIQE